MQRPPGWTNDRTAVVRMIMDITQRHDSTVRPDLLKLVNSTVADAYRQGWDDGNTSARSASNYCVNGDPDCTVCR